MKREVVMEAPQNPAGVFASEENYGPQRRGEFIAVIEAAPTALRDAVAGLAEDQLDTLYRNWTIRQIVHHVADSHVNSYVRFKWALTEELPTIKPYDEKRWAEMSDVQKLPINISLTLLHALHTRWYEMLRNLPDEAWQRTVVHPEHNKTITLWYLLGMYAWHGRHHVAHITALRDRNGW